MSSEHKAKQNINNQRWIRRVVVELVSYDAGSTWWRNHEIFIPHDANSLASCEVTAPVYLSFVWRK
jgi:hypothetical protein